MSDRSGSGLYSVFDRTITNWLGTWRDIAASARGVLSGTPKPELSVDDAERLRQQLRACLDGRGGEVSARARAADLGRTYLALNGDGRERFLRLLAVEFDIDGRAVRDLCRRLVETSDPAERARLERMLRAALDAPRVRLLTHFNALPEGVKFLVDMRAEIMALARGDAVLSGLDHDLKGLLAGWFDIGFLELKRITWDAAASLLEKLMRYEAVHEIRSWTDLKNRLEADRRCFAYFHPRMPDEPLIFVEVALVQGMSGNVQTLLDETAPVGDPAAADTAIFYSISNCQTGLAGISFGDFLIKRVVDHLAAELPHLKTYATLSPVPGFRAWLSRGLAEGGGGGLLPEEVELVEAAQGDAGGGLAALLARADWRRDEAASAALEAILPRLCAQYLLQGKTPSGRALDPVAHFHLSNGARVERLNWLGDTSPKGMEQSLGLMANYLYRLPDIERNHEAYVGEGVVAASSTLTRLADAGPARDAG
jgi:malonyl-CoA decarboxylase